MNTVLSERYGPMGACREQRIKLAIANLSMAQHGCQIDAWDRDKDVELPSVFVTLDDIVGFIKNVEYERAHRRKHEQKAADYRALLDFAKGRLESVLAQLENHYDGAPDAGYDHLVAPLETLRQSISAVEGRAISIDAR